MRSHLNDYVTDRQAEDYYLQYVGHKSIGKKEALNRAINQMNALTGSSLHYMLYKSILKALKGFSVGDYRQVTEVCGEALRFF